MNNLTFDNHNISTLYRVGNIEREIIVPTPETLEVPGRDGVAFRAQRMGASTVKATLYQLGGTEAERRTAAHTLAQWLNVRTPKRLKFDDDGNLYYMAVPSGPVSYHRHVNASEITLSFMLTEPAAYGTQKTANVSSGGSTTINVGGNYPTSLTVYAASATRNSSSLVWGIRVDDGDFIHVPTGTSSAVRLDIDSGARIATKTASRTVVMPTLDSDWIVLEPGTHTVANDQGTGACTLTWIERWL